MEAGRPGPLCAASPVAWRQADDGGRPLSGTAAKADDQLDACVCEHDLSGWLVDERLLVCIDPRPIARAPLRRGAHMVHRLGCPVFALHVEAGPLSSTEQEALLQNRTLAEQLGAAVESIQAEDPVEAIVDDVARRRISQVIIGHSQRSRWYEPLHGSLVQRLLRRLPEIDVHVVAERARRADGRQSRNPKAFALIAADDARIPY